MLRGCLFERSFCGCIYCLGAFLIAVTTEFWPFSFKIEKLNGYQIKLTFNDQQQTDQQK